MADTATPYAIDRSQVDTARDVSIVFLCLAANLPVLMVIVVVGIFKWRAMERENRLYAEDWNAGRMDSLRGKSPDGDRLPVISYISSNRLDVVHPLGLENDRSNFETRGVGVGVARIGFEEPARVDEVGKKGKEEKEEEEEEPKERTLHHFNDAFVEESSIEEEEDEEESRRQGQQQRLQQSESPRFVRGRSSSRASGSLLKDLLIRRASMSGRNSRVKAAIVQMISTDDSSREPPEPLEPPGNPRVEPFHAVRDPSPPSRGSNHVLVPPPKPIRTGDRHRVQQTDPNRDPDLQPKSNPSRSPTASGRVKPSANNSDVFFQSHNGAASHEPAPSESTLNELDYFASPPASEDGRVYRYSGRVADDPAPKLGGKFNLASGVAAESNRDKYRQPASPKNPLYEEEFDSSFINDGRRALEYYKSHGRGDSPRLHRHPGLLDLDKILESDGSLETEPAEGRATRRALETRRDSVLSYGTDVDLCDFDLPPPPPGFCDSPKPDVVPTGIFARKPQPPRPLPKPQRSTASFQAHIDSHPGSRTQPSPEALGSSPNVFDRLPEVRARKEFLERGTSSSKRNADRGAVGAIYGKDSILKEEEELALRYFEDICRELSSDSTNASEDSEKQATYHVSPRRTATRDEDDPSKVSPFFARPSVSPASPTAVGALPPNFRKSYEHLLSPDYPLQRRMVISSGLIDSHPQKRSADSKKVVEQFPAEGYNANENRIKGGWIVTHM